MVVLEGHNMMGVNSANQYLQPDYLTPLPTTVRFFHMKLHFCRMCKRSYIFREINNKLNHLIILAGR